MLLYVCNSYFIFINDITEPQNSSDWNIFDWIVLILPVTHSYHMFIWFLSTVWLKFFITVALDMHILKSFNSHYSVLNLYANIKKYGETNGRNSRFTSYLIYKMNTHTCDKTFEKWEFCGRMCVCVRLCLCLETCLLSFYFSVQWKTSQLTWIPYKRFNT